DNTYYAVPSPELVQGWVRKTPEGFTISAKFPRSIVHAGRGPRPDARRVLDLEATAADRETFLENMALLGRRCGPLVLQFPHFSKAAFEGPAPFLERLAAYLEVLPVEFRYAVEVRNDDWLVPELLDLLRQPRVALVWVELPRMPEPWTLREALDLVTTDFVYARLIGDRRATDALTKTFDEIVLDKSKNVAEWAGLLVPATARATEVFAYANNHYAGHGPATVRELARAVGQDLGPGSPPQPRQDGLFDDR
ncbi:MAG: DUF72 domain-containing protein, partial [Planctomycetota bacterium]|nr:DUF72 domain-containing protein [Planctomycetota bacterium]